jgi:hypothetical protein
MFNNIVYNWINNSLFCSGIFSQFNANSYAYNCTIYGCYYGFSCDGNATIDNILAYKNTINYDDGFSINSTNNLSDDIQVNAPGNNPRNGVNVTFVDEYNKDFHLASNDTGAIGYGISDPANGLFLDDIDNQLRVGNWDIGADQYVYNESASISPSISLSPSSSQSLSLSQSISPSSSISASVSQSASESASPSIGSHFMIYPKSIIFEEIISNDSKIIMRRCFKKNRLNKIITKISTITMRRKYEVLRKLYGIKSEIWLPKDGIYNPVTREGSMYNRESQEYRYSIDSDFPCEIMLYSNLMDMKRLNALEIMDNLDIEPVAYTLNEKIIPNSKVKILYRGKNFYFFVERVIVLTSPYPKDGKAVLKLKLIPHN